MTGNLVFIAVGLSSHDSALALHAVIAVGAFGAGAWATAAVMTFAMGMQTAVAVALGVHAVFTTAATATWTVLLGDAAHWSATRIERRRLALVLGGLLLGALIGGVRDGR